MRLRLYNYTAEKWIPNKLSTNPTQLFDAINDSGFNMKFSAFNPMNATFELSSLYGTANYCLFDFGGIDYFGYVTVGTSTKGIYTYSVQIDPLTTSWYRGCMNVTAKVLYSSTRDNFQLDRRIALAEHNFNFSLSPSGVNISELSDAWNYPWIVVAVYDPWASESYRFGYYQSPDAIRLFVFPGIDAQSINGAQNFRHFIKNCYRYAADSSALGRSADVSQLLQNIVGIYAIPSYLFEISTSATFVGGLTLHVRPSTQNGIVTSFNTITIPYGGGDYEYYACVELTKQINSSEYSDLNIGRNLEYRIDSIQRSDMWNGTIEFYIPYVGTFSIKPSLTIQKDATHLGFKISTDIESGTYVVLPYYKINDYSLEYMMNTGPVTFPIADSLCVPSVDPPKSFFERITATALSGSQIQTIVTGSKNIADFFTGGWASSVKNSGTGGGSPERPLQKFSVFPKYPVLRLSYNPYEDDQATFASKYGWPCNKTMNVSQRTGYVQTENVKLLSNGLSSEIIDAAESACNSGIFIV